MKLKNILLGIAVVAVVGLMFYFNDKTVVVNVPESSPVINVPEQKTPVVNVTVPASGTTQKTTLGSVTGPEVYSPYFDVNGIRTWYARPAMTQATTTLCAILSPAATSTLISTSWQISTGTSTAATIDLATSTTAYSTTTNLVSATSVASGATKSVVWYPNGSSQDSILSPNTYIIVKTAGAGLGGYKFTGTCKALMREL